MGIVATFLRRYAAPYLPWYLAGALLLGLTNWLYVTIPLFLAEAIDLLRAGSDPEGRIPRAALAIGAMGLTIIVTRTASRVLFFTPGRLVEARVKEDLLERILAQQPAFLRQWPPGDLVSRASSDVNYLRMLTGFGALQLVNTTVAVALTIAQMVRLSPTLALAVILPVASALLVTQLFIRRLFAYVREAQEALSDMSDHVLTSYQGVATVQGFVAEDAFLDAFRTRNQAHVEASLGAARMRAGIWPLLGFAASVNVFLLLYLGGRMAIEGTLTVGELVAFTTLVAFLTLPLRGTSFLITILKQAQAALERVEAVMAPAPERPDLPNPLAVPRTPPALEVRGLTFAYPDAPDDLVLEDVSFRVPPGGTLGLLGPTGAGKSTLLRCLTRLYNPPPGTIYVDGVDVRDLDLDAWRRQVAVVPQRAFLFSESLADNVLLGAEDDGRLARVLELTAMDVDVQALPEGTATRVGEAGVMLSGGQRQRTALARGLARDHTVLVLDDVLSAVDPTTEQQLIGSLRASSQAPTTVLVSHRVSALRHADVIVVMDGGRVVDQGTHAELLARPGLYRDTCERQREGDAA